MTPISFRRGVGPLPGDNCRRDIDNALQENKTLPWNLNSRYLFLRLYLVTEEAI